METSGIVRLGVRFASPQVALSQGKLLADLIADIAKHIPASGTKQATAAELSDALKLQGDDAKHFASLFKAATVGADGALTLSLGETFRFKPNPDARELIISQTLRGTIAPEKLLIAEGLGAKIGFVTARINAIEVVTQENVRGVRVSANLGSEFYPI